MNTLRNLHRDAKLLMASRGIRAFAFSYLNVVFAIYLSRLGHSTVTIGIVFSVAYLSGALLTAVWGPLSDRFGRRTILMLIAALTIVFAYMDNPLRASPAWRVSCHSESVRRFLPISCRRSP